MPEDLAVPPPPGANLQNGSATVSASAHMAHAPSPQSPRASAQPTALPTVGPPSDNNNRVPLHLSPTAVATSAAVSNEPPFPHGPKADSHTELTGKKRALELDGEDDPQAHKRARAAGEGSGHATSGAVRVRDADNAGHDGVGVLNASKTPGESAAQNEPERHRGNGAGEPGSVLPAPPSQFPEPDRSILPVVEPVVRKDGTDRYKKVNVEGDMDAAQRIERVQDERKKILPRAGIQMVLKRLGVADEFKLSEEVESAIMLLAETMLDQTMEFGCLMASRRQSKWLESKDVELYLERAWHIHLPGYGVRSVTPAPKVAPEKPDTRLAAAVREAMSELEPAVPQRIAARQAALEGNPSVNDGAGPSSAGDRA